LSVTLAKPFGSATTASATFTNAAVTQIIILNYGQLIRPIVSCAIANSSLCSHVKVANVALDKYRSLFLTLLPRCEILHAPSDTT
jgi:hypothetical protein